MSRKPIFAAFLFLSLSACAMETATSEDVGKIHEAGSTPQGATPVSGRGNDVKKPDAKDTTPGTGAPPPKPKGDPSESMDKPQPEPWDGTGGPSGTGSGH